MNKLLRSAIVTTALGAVVFSTVGCRVTVETKTKFLGTPIVKDVAWTSGMPVFVRSDNGNILIKRGGDATHVAVQAQPFAFAFDAEEGRQEMETKLSFTGEVDGNGTLVIDGNGGGDQGWELTVLMPTGFDAAIDVSTGNGPIDIDSGLETATSAKVVGGNGSIDVDLGNSAIDVFADNGRATVVVGGGGAGTVRTDNGKIEFLVPTTANATISAQALDGGEVLVVDGLPAGWTEAVASEASKSYTLNEGGGGYNLTAEGTGLADVLIFPQ